MGIMVEHSCTAPDIGPYHITGHLDHIQATRADCDLVALYCCTEWMDGGTSAYVAVYHITDCAAVAAAVVVAGMHMPHPA